MSSPDRLRRFYRPAQPVSDSQIDRFLHIQSLGRDKTPHAMDSDSSPREDANGRPLGGRRGRRIRNGVDGRSRSDGHKRPTDDAILRPRAGTIFPYNTEGIDGGFSLSGMEDQVTGNPQGRRLRKPRGDISLQNRGRR